MKPGDFFRTKKVRIYGDDPRNWGEFSPQYKDRIFVCLYLGTEPAKLVNDQDMQIAEPMNRTLALNRLGLVSEEQLIKAKAPKAFLERLKKLIQEERSKERQRCINVDP